MFASSEGSFSGLRILLGACQARRFDLEEGGVREWRAVAEGFFVCLPSNRFDGLPLIATKVIFPSLIRAETERRLIRVQSHAVVYNFHALRVGIWLYGFLQQLTEDYRRMGRSSLHHGSPVDSAESQRLPPY